MNVAQVCRPDVLGLRRGIGRRPRTPPDAEFPQPEGNLCRRERISAPFAAGTDIEGPQL
jgi:hypothetical protein